MNDGSDPVDKLDHRILDLQQQAQEDYDDEAVEAILGMLGDILRDLDSEVDGESFVAGYKYALHGAEEIYITYSGNFPCSCPNSIPLPGLYRDEVWRCSDCDAYLAELWELPSRQMNDKDPGGDGDA